MALIVCEPCGRRERYEVVRLQDPYGWDAKLPELFVKLVGECPERARRVCMIVFEMV